MKVSKGQSRTQDQAAWLLDWGPWPSQETAPWSITIKWHTLWENVIWFQPFPDCFPICMTFFMPCLELLHILPVIKFPNSQVLNHYKPCHFPKTQALHHSEVRPSFYLNDLDVVDASSWEMKVLYTTLWKTSLATLQPGYSLFKKKIVISFDGQLV